MKILRKNEGFTLVELMVTILVATIVTLSATTVLLLGIRIMNKSTDTAERQYTTRVLLTALEGIAAEGTVTEVKNVTVDGENAGWQVLDGTKVIFSYDRATQSVYTGEAAADKEPLLDGIAGSTAILEGNILTFMVQPNGQAPYETSIYCRLMPDDFGGDNRGINLITELQNEGVVTGRRAFLKVLASQYGSRGEIIGGDGTWSYFSEWYIEGYDDHPGWNENTPWCACFVSWALYQVDVQLMNRPNEAFVDDPDPSDGVDQPSFMQYFVTRDQWENRDFEPQAGDVVLFDTDDDPEADHMGVVLATTEDDELFTIEGNSYGRVRVSCYDLTDTNNGIVGYGILSWR